MDRAGEFDIADAVLLPTSGSPAVATLDDIRARDTERAGDSLHRVSPANGEGDSKVGFLPAPGRALP
jgi:hypothetical protein